VTRWRGGARSETAVVTGWQRWRLLGGSGGRRLLGAEDDGGGSPAMLRQWKPAWGRRWRPARWWSSSLTSTTQEVEDGPTTATWGKWRRQHFDLWQLGEEKGKKKKENGLFQESAYIHRLTDKYRRACTISPAPRQ
jgi:hypothetical protein